MMNLLEKFKLKFQQYRFRLLFPKNYKNGYVFGPFSIIHPQNLSFGKGLALNDFCYINATEKVFIGEKVAVSAGAKIITVKLNFVEHRDNKGRLSHVGGEIVIGNNVQIGANAVVLPGVTICDDVIIGAGAIVSKDIKESGIYVGIPARRL